MLPFENSPVPVAKHPKASSEAQHAKFVEAAKRLGTDDDPERFKETVKKLAKVKPEKDAEPVTRD